MVKARSHNLQPRYNAAVLPTYYRGACCRSRTEARWLVVLDTLKIRWRYEMEGLTLPSGWWMPDIYLPDYFIWAEIKGIEPTEIEAQLCSELAQSKLNSDVLLIEGAPSLDSKAWFYVGKEVKPVLAWRWFVEELGVSEDHVRHAIYTAMRERFGIATDRHGDEPDLFDLAQPAE